MDLDYDAKAGTADDFLWDAKAHAYHGKLELATDVRVSGWACDRSNYDTHLKVEILVGDRAIGTTVADIQRNDLKIAGMGKGDHAFDFRSEIPLGSVSVRIVGTNHFLGFHPKEVKSGENPGSAIDFYQMIKESGLFDPEWYLESAGNLHNISIDLLSHYCSVGFKEGRSPNFYFDTVWYADKHDLLKRGIVHPFLHFLTEGQRGGFNPGIYFDMKWYCQQYGISQTQSALGHYVRNCRSGTVSPSSLFDVKFYLNKNPDVKAAGVDPFRHFIDNGWREGRNPSRSFDVNFYIRRHLRGDRNTNPYMHYLTEGASSSLVTSPEDEVTWASERKRFVSPGDAYEDFAPGEAGAPLRAKLLAYYLPQYHAFPENDLWWGKGFTEWTNVVRGASRFVGHYQPRVPRDLGFYNLLDADTFRRQIDMARAAGIYGFVFYFYSFGKRRLMEAPLEKFLCDSSLDFPFCLVWANESWTRTWDGISKDVLIAQEYSDADDVDLVQTWLRHFRDRRYIRVGGRPVLMIYRPGIIPNVKAKLTAWRKMIVAASECDPIILMCQGFGDQNPKVFGFDGAIEFPPHKVVAGLSELNRELELFDLSLTGTVFGYDAVVERSLSEPAPDYPLIKAAFPSWDNDARRQGAGMVIHGSTPARYQEWLEGLVDFAEQHPFFGEKFIGVNAWNEWAEGAYLEPDVHFGAAYLNATARAILGSRQYGLKKLCFVGHDAHLHGAQLLLRSIAEVMKRQFGLEVEIVLLGDGKLVAKYEEIGATTVAAHDQALQSTFRRLFQSGFRFAILNSTASARAAQFASAAGLEVILLVHELPSIIAEMNLAPTIALSIPFVRHFVFPADFVRDKFMAQFDLKIETTIVRTQGCYGEIAFSATSRRSIRTSLGIGENDTMVLDVGFADLRKGFDLFLQAWRSSERRATGAHFVWVGDIAHNLSIYLRAEREEASASGRFHMVPFSTEVAAYYSAADVFLLTSREDPFPTVVLLALHAGIPTIAFEASGGVPEMLRRHDAGIVTPMADSEAVVDAVIGLRANWDSESRDGGNRLTRLAREAYSFPAYAFDLLKATSARPLIISVVVPNYNYERHLRSRLASIFAQHYPVFELIVLDDCSTDASLDVLNEIARETGRVFEIVPNEVNSGSVFRQWRKAAELATGDYVWIAEADDMADPGFLDRLASSIRDNEEEVTLAYTDSKAIDEHDVELSPNYKSYYAESSPGVFEKDVVFTGADFIRDHLSERNLILNVSACLWRRSALLDAVTATGDELTSYRLAGDWFLYINALRRSGGKVAYIADPLNTHRRHSGSVTHGRLTAERHIGEIRKVQLLARELLGDDDALTDRQDAYLRKVANHLGAPETADAAVG